jgi:hypothetical protein
VHFDAYRGHQISETCLHTGFVTHERMWTFIKLAIETPPQPTAAVFMHFWTIFWGCIWGKQLGSDAVLNSNNVPFTPALI